VNKTPCGTLGQYEFAFGFCGSVGLEISRMRNRVAGDLCSSSTCTLVVLVIVVLIDVGVFRCLHFVMLEDSWSMVRLVNMLMIVIIVPTCGTTPKYISIKYNV